MKFEVATATNTAVKASVGAVLAGAIGVCIALGLAAAAQAAPHGGRVAEPAGSACVIASRPYPQGTVVRMNGDVVLQRCGMKAGRPKWFRVEGDSEGETPVTDVSTPVETDCQETAPVGKLCTCGHREFSPGALVGSARGVLVCPAHGGHWQRYRGNRRP